MLEPEVGRESVSLQIRKGRWGIEQVGHFTDLFLREAQEFEAPVIRFGEQIEGHAAGCDAPLLWPKPYNGSVACQHRHQDLHSPVAS